MSAQRLRRWPNIVQVSYKCFVFAGQKCIKNHAKKTYGDKITINYINLSGEWERPSFRISIETILWNPPWLCGVYIRLGCLCQKHWGVYIYPCPIWYQLWPNDGLVSVTLAHPSAGVWPEARTDWQTLHPSIVPAHAQRKRRHFLLIYRFRFVSGSRWI